jgi:hypothetical protein
MILGLPLGRKRRTTMAAITYGANAKTTPVAPVAPAAKRQNIFRLLLEAFIEARQMQAEAEIRRHYGNLGHYLPKTDEADKR